MTKKRNNMKKKKKHFNCDGDRQNSFVYFLSSNCFDEDVSAKRRSWTEDVSLINNASSSSSSIKET